MYNDIYETAPKPERFLLAAAEDPRSNVTAEQSLDELAELLETAGGEECGRIIQRRETPDPGTYLGEGKLEELRNALALTGADGVITDDELSPAQLRNMADILKTKVLDRTLLILDIFSQRATTREGQLQVELADLSYRLTRLTGLGRSLSQQGGTIGRMHSRGAGETRLELDRRAIRSRMDALRRQLAEIEKNRDTMRSQRVRNRVPHAALVGYTNAGKSTIFNRITGAGVLEEDKLFATLDTTTRRIRLPGGREILLSDTVGFIRKLPHMLVEAFHATLEEVRYADILVIVVDASDDKASAELAVTRETLRGLGASGKPVLLLYNKQDLVTDPDNVILFPGTRERILKISALRESDLVTVQEEIERILKEQEIEYTVLIPYADGRIGQFLRENARVLSEEYNENGTVMQICSDASVRDHVRKYLWKVEQE